MGLVVDDYADARAIDAAWLRLSGDRVALTGTVTEALSWALRDRPDAVPMDRSMPVIGDVIPRTGRRSPAVPA